MTYVRTQLELRSPFSSGELDTTGYIASNFIVSGDSISTKTNIITEKYFFNAVGSSADQSSMPFIPSGTVVLATGTQFEVYKSGVLNPTTGRINTSYTVNNQTNPYLIPNIRSFSGVPLSARNGGDSTQSTYVPSNSNNLTNFGKNTVIQSSAGGSSGGGSSGGSGGSSNGGSSSRSSSQRSGTNEGFEGQFVIRRTDGRSGMWYSEPGETELDVIARAYGTDIRGLRYIRTHTERYDVSEIPVIDRSNKMHRDN